MAVNIITPMDCEARERDAVSDSITSRLSSPLKSDGNVQSRYLRPRIASCHDLCKYGKKHDSEAEAKRLNFRKFLKRNLDRDVGQNHVTRPNLCERGIRTATKPMKSVYPGDQKKATMVERGTSYQFKPSNQPVIIEKKSNFQVKRPISSDVPEKIRQKVLLPPKRLDVVGKPATPLKRKATLIRSLSNFNFSRSITRRNQENKKILGASKVGERKVLKPSTASLSFKSSWNLISHMNLDKKLTKSATISKLGSFKTPRGSVSKLLQRKLLTNIMKQILTPHNIVGEDMESKSVDLNPILENEESESANSGVSDEEIEGDNKIEVSKDNNTSMFKKGKVDNLRSDSIGVRRLWLTIGKMASENPNSDSLLWNGSFRRKRYVGSLDSNAPDSEVCTVVLKHQSATEKKDDQSLFNHVIEETASKLVETRRSKVKALVGAFETVISLQETKPASAI